ncbi:aquaporin-like protein [Phakopsora pachyrhizi]|uniref:Aquaporin-like protein n=1 Tax=Phakopsora pachyrhizi TaxID=170000 RepID=A0AAV0BSQ3_PHAPC|nr:aquaporin-like protein [Phakopsora pachyrhizi]
MTSHAQPKGIGSSINAPGYSNDQSNSQNQQKLAADDADHSDPLSVLPALDSNFQEIQSRRINENGASSFRSHTREFWAEFFGTLILALIGNAVNCQVTLGGNSRVTSTPRGDWTTVSINPAVTLTLALLRGLPIYWLAQFLGAFVGAGLGYMSNLGSFFNEFLMTAILMICAVGDKGNLAPPKGLSPFVILWVVFALASTLLSLRKLLINYPTFQTSFALNPARDIGPRLLTWTAGYGSGVWRIRSGYVFFCINSSIGSGAPPLAQFGNGTFVGCFLYDCLVGTENVDSPLHNATLTNFIRKIRGLEPLNDEERQNSGDLPSSRKRGSDETD